MDTMNTIENAPNANTNNVSVGTCSKENNDHGDETSSVVSVKEIQKSKGHSAIGLLTRRLKKKKKGNTSSSKSDPDNGGPGSDPRAIMMVEVTNKSPRHSARYFLHQMLKTKKAGKNHLSSSSPDHDGTVSDSTSIMTIGQPSNYLSGSARQFLNLKLKTKKSGKKHSSKSNPDHLDFSQNLELGYLAEASQQLLDRENCLFISQPLSKDVFCTDDAKNGLKKDYETLMDHLKMAVHNSFNIESQELLRNAITAIVQQEEQDRLWEKASEEAPLWRPMRGQLIHDTIVTEVVEVRLQQVNGDDSDADTLKREVARIGSVIQNDLLQVLRCVQTCYSSDFNVCNMYAQLYHQAFSTTLRKLLQCSLTLEDKKFILQQINSYSKDILHLDELKPHINTESLGALLPEEDHKSLEEQYMSHKENEVKTWLSNALKLKEADWQANKKPELIDEYYFCHLAVDVIGVVDGGIKDIEVIVGNDKAQGVLLQMGSFLLSYKNSMEEFLESQQMHIGEIVKSQLFNINKIREYIKRQDYLPDEVQVAWLSIVSELRDSCHSYLLNRIHKELMVTYRKLWTPAWFSEHEKIIDKLEDTLNEKIHSLKGLHCDCRKELLSQLHFEVMIEYVRRMLKRKLKLNNQEKQETAAHFLCQDSDRINTLFGQNGSEKEWLSEILPRVSEVIKDQDPDNLQLDLCALLKHHPDLSERQICQLLQLKTRCPDVHMVRECYNQTINNLEESEPTSTFFCHVPRSISMSFYSCFCMIPFYMKEASTCSK